MWRLATPADYCRRILSAAVIFVASLAGLQSAQAERRVALVIGNSTYKHTQALSNPRNDASAVAAALKRLDFEVITSIDLTATTMRRTVKRFAKAIERADVALLYYAGHGLQFDGENYLVPVDAALASDIDLEFEATELKLFLRLMDREAKTSLVFLDACRDNPLAGNLARSMGTKRSASIGRGLARVESGVGTFISYSTQPGNYALDGDGRHSPYTAALLEHLETPGLGIAQLMQRVRSTVLTQTKGKQVPWDHSSLTREFFFKAAAPKKPPTAATTDRPSPTAPQQFELMFWDSVRASKDPADYSAYLEQFPKGKFAPLARNRLMKLRQEQRIASTQPTAPVEVSRNAPSETIAPMQNRRMVQRTARIRSEPNTSGDVLVMASKGHVLDITGKVEGANWYRTKLPDGRIGYIYGGLLGPLASVQPARKPPVMKETVKPSAASKPASPSGDEIERKRQEIVRIWDRKIEQVRSSGLSENCGTTIYESHKSVTTDDCEWRNARIKQLEAEKLRELEMLGQVKQGIEKKSSGSTVYLDADSLASKRLKIMESWDVKIEAMKRAGFHGDCDLVWSGSGGDIAEYAACQERNDAIQVLERQKAEELSKIK